MFEKNQICATSMFQLSSAGTIGISLLLTSLPFLLLGILVSSCILVFVDANQLITKFPRNPILGAILGSALGVILPVSQYGNIPVTRRLLIKGTPVPVAMSFLMASATLNPITIWFTWRAFPGHTSMVLYQLLFSWLMAIAVALIFSAYKESPVINDGETVSTHLRSSLLLSGSFFCFSQDEESLHRVGNLVYEYKSLTNEQKPLLVSLVLLGENFFQETLELMPGLIIGCAIATCLQMLFPQSFFLNLVRLPVIQILGMMGLGFILSLGSVFNGSFLSGLIPLFPPGSLLSFLWFSSIIDLKSLCLLLCIFRPKFVIYLTILIAELTFLGALIFNFYIS